MALTDGWVFLSVTVLIAVGVFLNGVRFSRMRKNPFVGRSLFGQPIQGTELSIHHIRWIGKIQMIFAPVFLLFAAAMTFGFFGPVEGITIIKFN